MQRKTCQTIVRLEVGAFGFLFALLWVDEILDFPHYLMGAPATPVNWRESLMESAFTLALGILVVGWTRSLLGRIRFLEGLLAFCSSCRKVRLPGTDPMIDASWVEVDDYLRSYVHAQVSHGICPACARRLYGEYADSLLKPTEGNPLAPPDAP